MQITRLSFSGWRVNIGSLNVCDITISPLTQFLDDLAAYQLCSGVCTETKNTRVHTIQNWSNDNMELVKTNYYRSPHCQIVLKDRLSCCPCEKYEIKTVYNRKYEKRSDIPDVSSDDLMLVDETLHKDISNLIDLEAPVMNEWQKMFFEEQNRNAEANPKGRRYHPDVIRWAIEMFSKSPAAYEQLRTSGVLTLPSATTLRQYR
uniref:uncharacterized protein LOC120329584 isoform X1 n=1 Tax=Styela clava TaxID=7725 RepID=UPI001939DB7B|nr:uncharacterized protein LOC120329584 isoform X1 [Styela clava]